MNRVENILKYWIVPKARAIFDGWHKDMSENIRMLFDMRIYYKDGSQTYLEKMLMIIHYFEYGNKQSVLYNIRQCR